ncbi:NAD(P)H-binding protein [Microbacterium sp. 2FI]|uniref:SDR family oxidoreductase n=1 Tax=Microbacterium sp. 2FI TaxID=2502193 RepID=UPI0010F843AE|nr:NAD(P)H-binding protein [Microbacterium sp. 2FI]
MRIAIAGGSGLAGTPTAEIARTRGHDVVILARGHGVELLSGSGLTGALRGVDAVIDVSNVATLKPDVSVSFFAGATRNLLAAERAAGVGHHIVLTIVGADAAPDGYYAGKLVQERLVEAGSTPWTIQRATQFHEFAPMMYHSAKAGPLHLAPRARTQPIAVREVAEHLVTLAEQPPAGRALELGGPQEESLVEMVRAYARAIGGPSWIPAVSLPGTFGRAQRSGALLPGPGAILGRQTYAEWLDELPDA